MANVGIYGWECGWWCLRPWWGTGKGLGGAQVVVAGREFGHAVHVRYTNKAQQRRRY